MKIFVVIPTLERLDRLRNIVRRIKSQTYEIEKIIIIDSSEKQKYQPEDTQLEVVIETKIKSSATQRNLGIRYILSNYKFNKLDVVAFIDDDLEIGSQYLENLVDVLKLGYDGVSGIALDRNRKFNFFNKIFIVLQYIFRIQSFKQGKVLKSGFATPVKQFGDETIVEVEWLIACSIWRMSVLRNLLFDENMTGYALGEDVIFSSQAFVKGAKLAVNREVVFYNDTFENEKKINFIDYLVKLEYLRESVIAIRFKNKKNFSYNSISSIIYIIKIIYNLCKKK